MLIVAQDLIDDPHETVQFRTPDRLRPAIPGRQAVAQHLAHRLSGQSEASRRRTLAQPFHIDAAPYLSIELHLIHPSCVPRNTIGMLGGPLERSGFPPPSGDADRRSVVYFCSAVLSRVLDGGAGSGLHALQLQARGLDVTAVDVNRQVVAGTDRARCPEGPGGGSDSLQWRSLRDAPAAEARPRDGRRSRRTEEVPQTRSGDRGTGRADFDPLNGCTNDGRRRPLGVSRDKSSGRSLHRRESAVA